MDGVLAGQLSANSTMPEGTSVPAVDGGGPSATNGPVVLCSRTDGDAARFFDGSIAQLGACASPGLSPANFDPKP